MADSSYIVEGLLSKKENLSKDQIITPQLAVYEVANAIWKQDCLLKKLQDGQVYLGYFYGLVDSGKIVVMHPNENLMHESYLMAKGNNIAMYDSIFICLAIKLGLTLKTLDNRQAKIFENLNKKQSRVH